MQYIRVEQKNIPLVQGELVVGHAVFKTTPIDIHHLKIIVVMEQLWAVGFRWDTVHDNINSLFIKKRFCFDLIIHFSHGYLMPKLFFLLTSLIFQLFKIHKYLFHTLVHCQHDVPLLKQPDWYTNTTYLIDCCVY